MAGIYGVFLKEKKVFNFFELFLPNPIKNEIEVEQGIVGRSTINKVGDDRFIETIDGITICFEGINLSDAIDEKAKFFKAYNERGIGFIKELKGTYSGFVHDGNEKKLYVFNDHLSTKNVFYYHQKNIGFVFSSELKPISRLFRKHGIPFSIDTDSIYMMALYGFLLEDHTYFNEIKKLPYSSLLCFDLEKQEIKIDKLFSYSNSKRDIPYSKALDQINQLMEHSVSKNWSKDLKYTTKHLSLLSGGMDARANIIIAKELGFSNITAITFGQSSSKDLKYAKEIAIGEKINYFQRFLDNPNYLIDDITANYIAPNDGLMMFQTSAHTYSTVNSFNLSNYTSLHTGQIGDLLFGSFTKENYDFKKNRGSIGYTGFVSNKDLLDKIDSLPNVLAKYQERGMELYTYEQRVINGTLVGDRSLNNTIDNSSPFFDLDLIRFCLSLPNRYKKSQMIYFDWLKKHHKQVLQYPWDKIEMLPNNKYKIIYGKKLKKYINGGKKYFNLNYDSMNPYGQWLKQDLSILAALNKIVEDELDKKYIDKEIQRDLLNLYENNIFEYRNKFSVATVLLALKYHFEDE